MNHCAIFRRCLLVGAACLGAAAVLLVIAVIPGVLQDTFPLATPRKAATGTAVIALATLAVAALAWRIARRETFAGWKWRIGVGAMAVPMLLLTVAVLDGAMTMWGHGARMHWVALAMFLCATLEFSAAMLTIAAAALWVLDGGEPGHRVS